MDVGRAGRSAFFCLAPPFHKIARTNASSKGFVFATWDGLQPLEETSSVRVDGAWRGIGTIQNTFCLRSETEVSELIDKRREHKRNIFCLPKAVIGVPDTAVLNVLLLGAFGPIPCLVRCDDEGNTRKACWSGCIPNTARKIVTSFSLLELPNLGGCTLSPILHGR
jgi:hypothetical protein